MATKPPRDIPTITSGGVQSASTISRTISSKLEPAYPKS
jgi:hypothetical protein